MLAREIAFLDPAALASAWRGPGLGWLDGDGSPELGRFSFVARRPAEIRRAAWGDPDPFAVVRGLGGRAGAAPASGLEPAIVPRWIGVLSYDAAFSRGQALGLRRPARLPRAALPVAHFARYDALVAVDHVDRRAWVAGDEASAVDRLAGELAEGAPAGAAAPRARLGPVQGEPGAAHLDAIAAAMEAILAGDIYQANLARSWHARLDGDPLALFLAMRRASPVPLGAFLEAGGFSVLGRSMERFLRLDPRDRSIETRPIKGTIARAGDERAEARALGGDEKERAEHAMIVDLMRNDLGRLAEIGSVRVHDAMRVEPYAALSHLVSTVRARLRPEVGLDEVLDATFPPGSVTGAPKLRAMELIEELEREARGFYCGAVGHVDHDGGLSLAVSIRTATVAGGEVRYPAGGGIVEASDPARELAETELKARVFLEAAAALPRS